MINKMPNGFSKTSGNHMVYDEPRSFVQHVKKSTHARGKVYKDVVMDRGYELKPYADISDITELLVKNER